MANSSETLASSEQVSEAEVDAALGDAFTTVFGPIVGVLAILYALLAIAHLLVLPEYAAAAMALLAGATAALCTLLWWLWGRKRPGSLAAHRWAFVVCASIIANVTVHLVWMQDPLQSTTFAILIIGLGCIFLSGAWYATILTISLFAWAGAMAALDTQPPVHFAFLIFMATVTSLIVYLARITITRSMARARLTSARQASAAEAARLMALRQSERQLAQIVNALPQAIYVRDRHLLIRVNRSFAELWGLTPDDMSGEALTRFFGPRFADMAVLFRGDDEVLDGGGDAEATELHVQTPDGGHHVLVANKIPLFVGGQPCVVGVLTDVSQQREFDQEKGRLGSQMQHAQKLESIGLLAGGIAHDFNNLLTAMIGNLAMLEDRLTDQDLHKRFVEPASQAAGRAAHLTRQLLAYAGRDTNVAETLDLETEVRELSGLLSTAVSRRIALRYDVASGPFHVHSDRGQFQQVMMNLVINAAESYLDRGGEVRIGIRQEELDGTDRFLNVTRLNAGPYVRLTVEDDGCGMKPELLEEMFDPFFSTKHAGRGLGLSAVVAVLNANDAGITVRSHVGLGTRFDVLWPERIVAGPGQSSPVRQPYTVAGQVLVVDDEPAIGELAREVLAGDGHQTTVVQDGDEALALLRDPTGHFDVILLDLMMPGTDGFAVLDALIDEQPDLPVVLTSGYDPRKEAEARFNRALELQFLRKPYRPDELRAAVAAALGEAVSPVSGSTVHG